MPIDKSWMQLRDRRLPEYEKGIDNFIAFAYGQPGVGDCIRCPCTRCLNVIFKKRDEVKVHLFRSGMDPNYSHWFHHGEDFEATLSDGEDNSTGDAQDMRALLNDLYGQVSNLDGDYHENVELDEDHGTTMQGEEGNTSCEQKPNKEAEKYYKLLEECEHPLYPGCENFSKLSFMVRLLNIKCLHGWSDTGFTSLLELLLEAFPSAQIPSSYYEAKKIITDLGHHYEKIDACKNDCLLYRKEFAAMEQCPICGTSRWINGDENDALGSQSNRHKKIPQKVLRYFPLIPRLKRLYLNSNIAFAMRWHKEKREDDGKLRHPADSLAWKTFDENHAEFASDARNVRLALASDGFNPFGSMNVAYSMWPVILIPYNLPPWMCMKSSYFMMSLLIPGPKAPGNDIDVYMQPLIDELKDLWDIGVEAFDAYGKENFQLHAALLWTINDFPAYGNLSGWSTKGALACPCCSKDTVSERLAYGSKECYMGHRRYLPLNHRWRNDVRSFNGKKEKRTAPKQVSGDDILEELDGYEQIIFGKMDSKKRKRKHNLPYNWKKKSIFFTLPYWRTLLIRHNLDVMHIEKNICDSILGTLMGVEHKTKDSLNARLDMEKMNIKKDLWPERDENGNVIRMPAACYTLSKREKLKFCEFFVDLKVPDGYSSNISRCVNLSECKIINLKSHDCHVILHRYLPLAIRGLLPKEVSEPLVELSAFYRELCSKVLDTKDLDRLEHGIVITLCKLERIFPPAFFDVMVHLSVHLASEAKIAGPVQYRWMFVVERFLKILKSYVRNKARPEGSIAEGYIAQECLDFCSHYLTGIDTRLNRAGRNYDKVSCQESGLAIFSKNGFHLKAPVHDVLLSIEEWKQARMYALKNCEEVMPFIEEHKAEMSKESKIRLVRRHEEKFPDWFCEKINRLYRHEGTRISEQLLHLAQGPNKRVTRYTGYVINGFRFHPKSYEEGRRMKTQNSGVVVKGDESTGSREYFGVLLDIIQLTYNGGNEVVLFKCQWWDIYNQGRGYKEDQHGCFMINTSRELKTDEPYILACQAEQVYYVRDNKDPKWHVVVKTRPRDFFEMSDLSKRFGDEEGVVDTSEPIQENELIGHGFRSMDTNDDESFNLRRSTDS